MHHPERLVATAAVRRPVTGRLRRFGALTVAGLAVLLVTDACAENPSVSDPGPPATVTSCTGQASSPFSIQKPFAPRE